MDMQTLFQQKQIASAHIYQGLSQHTLQTMYTKDNIICNGEKVWHTDILLI